MKPTPEQNPVLQSEPRALPSLGVNLLFLAALTALFLGLGFFLHGQELFKPFSGLPGDDWTFYHQRALDVLNNGLLMPLVEGPYTIPAGFSYVYFVALIYKLAGVNPGVVYLVQSAMLGLSLGLLFLAFAGGMSRWGKFILLAALLAYAFIDVQRYYACALLSENLVILEIGLCFVMLRLGYGRDKGWARVAALALLGPIYLTRPNMLPFAMVCVLWLALKRHGPGKASYGQLILGLGLALFIINLLGLRNFLVSGQWLIISPLTWAQAVDGHLPNPWHWLSHPLEVAWSLLIRTLYAAGFMPLIVDTFSYRPHWWLLWSAYLLVTIKRLLRREPFSFMERSLHIYVLTVLGPIILVGHITGYGFRFLVPVTLPALGLAARVWDELCSLRRPPAALKATDKAQSILE